MAPLNRVFSPSPVEAARSLVVAYEARLAAGEGVAAQDGEMVDMAMVKRARRVLARPR